MIAKFNNNTTLTVHPDSLTQPTFDPTTKHITFTVDRPSGTLTFDGYSLTLTTEDSTGEVWFTKTEFYAMMGMVWCAMHSDTLTLATA